MVMVHISTKSISRKQGQSAVASASYRAADKLHDERYGKTHDYSKKRGVMSTDIVLPGPLRRAGFQVSRSELWNKAENIEVRADSRVAREWLVNLPHELNEQERHTLAYEFAQALADKYHIIADVCIHKPVLKRAHDPTVASKHNMLKQGESNPDPRNFHAHILVTTREAKFETDGSLYFDPSLKIPFEWSNKKRSAHGLQSSIKEIKEVRELWVSLANKRLNLHGLGYMDARSFKDQGEDHMPTIKMGLIDTNMERRGKPSFKGDINKAIRARNELVANSKIRLKPTLGTNNERRISEPLEWRNRTIDWAAARYRQVVKRVDDSQQCIAKSQRYIDGATKRAEHIIQITASSKQCVTADKPGMAKYELQASEVNRLVDDRNNKPAAPNPFDDKARRARAARIAEQQRQVDNDATEYDRRTRYHHRTIEDAHRRAQRIRLGYAKTFLSRQHDDHRLSTLYSERSDDYPHKFDPRQSELLDAFSQKLSLNKEEGEDRLEYIKRINATFTVDFIKDNPAPIALLQDPKAERVQYESVKKDFDDFIRRIDQQKEAAKDAIRLPILNLNTTTDMVKSFVSAPAYLQQLTEYIDASTTADINQALAVEHRDKTIRQSVAGYKIACESIKNFPSTDIREAHTEALQGSVNSFMKDNIDYLVRSQITLLEKHVEQSNQNNQSYTPKFR